jgi:hypothetical protein
MFWPWSSPKTPAAERRSAFRLDKVFPVFIEGDLGGARGVARNISSGGLFVEVPITYPIGSQVRVIFTSPDGEMAAVGEVRYVCALTGRPDRPSHGPVGVRGMGLRFLRFEVADEAGAADAAGDGGDDGGSRQVH